MRLRTTDYGTTGAGKGSGFLYYGGTVGGREDRRWKIEDSRTVDENSNWLEKAMRVVSLNAQWPFLQWWWGGRAGGLVSRRAM